MPLIDPNPLRVTNNLNGSCGIYEIDLISKFKTSQEAMRAFWEKVTTTLNSSRSISNKKPFIIFSATPKGNNRYGHLYTESNADPTYGERFKKYIEDNDLGLVMTSEERPNWNENILVIYVWHINWDKLANLMKPLDEEERKMPAKTPTPTPQPESASSGPVTSPIR